MLNEEREQSRRLEVSEAARARRISQEAIVSEARHDSSLQPLRSRARVAQSKALEKERTQMRDEWEYEVPAWSRLYSSSHLDQRDRLAAAELCARVALMLREEKIT